MVQMQHPKLPKDQTIDVPENGVAHRERAGWRVKAEKPPEKPVEHKPVGKAEAKPSNNDEGAS